MMMTIDTAVWNQKMNEGYISDDSIADTILCQLGGRRFLIMTGATDLRYEEQALEMTLPKNKSKANRLRVEYDYGMDAYNIRFYRYTAEKLSTRTYEWTPAKEKDVAVYNMVYSNELVPIFEGITGLYTKM